MRKLMFCFLLIVFGQSLLAQVSIHQLLCEQMSNPIGVGVKKPRFTWKIQSETPSTIQTAYELIVKKGKQKVWATGKVASEQSVYIEYNGQPLEQDTRYSWQVRVWDNHGNESTWSAPAIFHTAFFDSSAWKAK